MGFTYTIPDRFLNLAKEQVWETRYGLEMYGQIAEHEFNQIAPYLGTPRVVLDMCAGLGRASIYLNHLLSDPSVKYILADRHGRTKNTGAFNPVEDEYYNDLDLALSFCKLNGIKRADTFDTENGDWSELPKVDLIISTVGLGFHVSIGRYIDRLASVASENCTMIFGTRLGRYCGKSFSDKFREVIYLEGTPRPQFPLENWLILKGHHAN